LFFLGKNKRYEYGLACVKNASIKIAEKNLKNKVRLAVIINILKDNNEVRK